MGSEEILVRRDELRVEGGGGGLQQHFLPLGRGDVEGYGEIFDPLDGHRGGLPDVADDDLGVDAFFHERFHLL